MLDSLTSRNHRDFHARYHDTFCFLTSKENNERKLVHITDVTDDRVYFRQDESEMRFHANIDAGVMFDFIPVDHGWYNAHNSAPMLLERVPARQWKRGISRQNTNVTVLVNNAGRYGGPLTSVRPSFMVLNSIFTNPQPYRFDPTQKYGSAFSKHFVLTPTGKVMFYRAEIGEFDGKSITLHNDLVSQEVRDALRRSGSNTEVVVNG